jgi:cell division initiation protein
VRTGQHGWEDDVERQEGRQPLTPTAIRNAEPRRAWLRGYERDAVHQLLDDVADTLAAAMRERDDLAGRVAGLELEAGRHRELEAALGSALVAGEQAAQEAKAQARRESDLIVREAHAEARRTVRTAEAERRHLEDGMIEVRARLRALLGPLGATDTAPPAREEPASDAVDLPAPDEALEGGIRQVVA